MFQRRGKWTIFSLLWVVVGFLRKGKFLKNLWTKKSLNDNRQTEFNVEQHFTSCCVFLTIANCERSRQVEVFMSNLSLTLINPWISCKGHPCLGFLFTLSKPLQRNLWTRFCKKKSFKLFLSPKQCNEMVPSWELFVNKENSIRIKIERYDRIPQDEG